MELSFQEKRIIENIFTEVKFCSEWNEEMKKYTDHPKRKIMLNFSEEEFKMITAILKKIAHD